MRATQRIPPTVTRCNKPEAADLQQFEGVEVSQDQPSPRPRGPGCVANRSGLAATRYGGSPCSAVDHHRLAEPSVQFANSVAGIAVLAQPRSGPLPVTARAKPSPG